MATINIITSGEDPELVTCQLCNPNGQACVSKFCLKSNIMACFVDLASNFPNLPGSEPDPTPAGIIAQLQRLNGEDDNCGDQLLMELHRSLLRMTSEEIRQFSIKQRRLIDTDVTNLVARPGHAVKVVCRASINGGGLDFAKCVNEWFNQNPDGCLRIYQSDGNWCADKECVSLT